MPDTTKLEIIYLPLGDLRPDPPIPFASATMSSNRSPGPSGSSG